MDAPLLPPATASVPPPPSHPHKGWLKKILSNGVKLLVAALGIWFVARMISWRDTAVVPAGTSIRNVTIAKDTDVAVLGKGDAVENTYTVEFPAIVQVNAELPGGRVAHELNDGNREELNFPRVLSNVDAKKFKLVENSPVHEGLRSILIKASAKWYLLVAAWAILVIPFLVTAIRWRNLMKPQGINMPLGKCLELTFVGQFFSIMLPGITGGDLVKIVYAARLTGSKTKSLITILLDRVIGLLALMVIGGSSAAVQLIMNSRAGHPVDATLRNVLLLIAGILVCIGLFCLVYFSHRLRAMTGLGWILRHPKMPGFIKHADEVLHVYRGHFGLLGWAFFISLISQLTLPVSAWLSGLALGIPMGIGYYLAYVPVAILTASLPISPPQGVGALDWVVVHFFAEKGAATTSQAFALTQSIRFLPMLWNLVGAYWVFTGNYSRHKMHEEEAALEAAEHAGEAGEGV